MSINESKIETAVPSSPWKIGILAHGAGFATVAVLLGLGSLFPNLITTGFSLPAARLAALFLGAPLEMTPDGAMVLNHRAIEVEVTGACSGFTFFTLCCAIFAGFISIRCAPRQWARSFPVLLFLAWVMTVLANSFRMVCAVQVKLLTSPWIPDSYDGAIHMTVGMTVFLPVLFASWNLLQRYYEPKPN